MTRPFADTTKVKMNYSICAPRMYRGRIDSLVNRVYWVCGYDSIDSFKDATSNVTYGT